MSDEEARIEALRRLVPIENPQEPEFGHLVRLAARIFETPTAAITLVDGDHQWFMASFGFEGEEIARDLSFCDHTIRETGLLVVGDATKDARFMANAAVTGEQHLRFYAGAPLVTTAGHAVGAVCVWDYVPRVVTPYQQAMLLTLADQVVTQLELSAARAYFAEADAIGRAAALPGTGPASPAEGDWEGLLRLKRLVTGGLIGYLESTTDGVIQAINEAGCRMLGYSQAELVGSSARALIHPDHVADTDNSIADLVTGRRSFYDATRVYRHRNGRKVHLRATVAYSPPQGSSPASVAALFVDVTGQVNADVFRVVAEQDRRRVLDTATDAYISLDDQGVVRDWNPAAERLFGYPAAVAVGCVLSTLIVPPELAEAHHKALFDVASGGTPTLLGRSIELPARHQDGSSLQVELTAWSTTLASGRMQFHAFCRDISERSASRAALVESNRLLLESREQFHAAFEASPTADAVLDHTGRLVEVNAALCRFLGQPATALVGRQWADVVYPPDSALAQSVLTEALTAPTPVYRTEMRCLTIDRRVVWGLVSVMPMTGRGSATWLMLRVEDIQAHKDLEGMLERQASHDPISGLPNRSLFLERVRALLVPRKEVSPVGVLVIEVDGLHAVIDRDGYAAGDQLLAEIAERMQTDLAQDVTLAHLRSGQFGAVLQGGAREAAKLSDSFLSAVRTWVDTPGGPVSLRASIGISIAVPHAGSAASQIGHVVQDAENAAQLARAAGSDCSVFAAPEMREAQHRQHDLEVLIRDALVEDQIHVAYQPVFDLATGLVVSVEALLRMFDSDGSPLPPLEVIPAAEASGLIVDIGRRVLHLAAKQAAAWRASFGVLIPVAVNVSAVQLSREGFPEDVLGALDMAGVPPESLSLELTESVLLKAGSTGIDQLRKLRDSGVQLAIDDFGTGYASLSYLRDLPANTLKIDQSFVAGIPDDPGAMAIVSGVIGLADSFGMRCIAEGIETDVQRDYLALRGVMGQGFLLGRPAEASVIDELLRSERE